MNQNIYDFKTILTKRKYSPKTIVSYVGWINDIENFYLNKDIKNLSNQEIKNYKKHLTDQRKLSSSTIRQAVYALNIFYEYVGRNDLTITEFSPGKSYRPIPDIPSQEEILSIIQNVPSSLTSLGLSLIYGAGLELSEALNVKVKDININKKMINILLLRKKETRQIIIPNEILEKIQNIIKEKKQEDFLFSNKDNESLSPSSFQKALTKARRKANIEKSYNIRSLRHAYIKHLEFSGVPLVKIIENLGLSNDLSLSFYSRIGYPDIAINFSPLDRKIITLDSDTKVFENPFVSDERINALSKLRSEKYDLTRLLELLRELNQAHRTKSLMAISMLVRAIIDHVPPIFDVKNFNEISSNYSGSKSFKKSMEHLNNSLRNTADSYLHVQIRKSESLPTFNQVDFRSDIDTLLSEIIRILIKNA